MSSLCATATSKWDSRSTYYKFTMAARETDIDPVHSQAETQSALGGRVAPPPLPPPYMRVRIGRFSSVELEHVQQPGKTERVEVSHRKCRLQGRAVSQTPGTMRTASGLSRQGRSAYSGATRRLCQSSWSRVVLPYRAVRKHLGAVGEWERLRLHSAGSTLPTFGRPVHLRGSPHRLRPGTSPHAFQIPSRDGHPALRRIAPPADDALPPSLDMTPLIRAPEGLQPSRTTRCSAHTMPLLTPAPRSEGIAPSSVTMP
jgi:hypothetical protein